MSFRPLMGFLNFKFATPYTTALRVKRFRPLMGFLNFKYAITISSKGMSVKVSVPLWGFLISNKCSNIHTARTL